MRKGGYKKKCEAYEARLKRRSNAIRRVERHLKRVVKKLRYCRVSHSKTFVFDESKVDGRIVRERRMVGRGRVEIRRRFDDCAAAALVRIKASHAHTRGSYGRFNPEEVQR